MKIKKMFLEAVLPIVLCLIFTFSLAGCSSDRFMNDGEILNAGEITGTITLRMTNEYGKYPVDYNLEYELYYDKAPITVTNFINLVESGYYDWTTYEDNKKEDGTLKAEADCMKTLVHRLEKSVSFFLIQTGGYKEVKRASGSYDIEELAEIDYSIKGEFAENGWTKNEDISHTSGTLSMARQNAYDTASTQFFITLGDCSQSLDGKYAAFGRIKSISSHMQHLKDAVTETRTLINSSTSFNNYPQQKIELISITVSHPNVAVFPKALHLAKSK